MKMRKLTVGLDKIHTNLFVRLVLNQEHALYLAELIENGQVLRPIMVTPAYRVLDDGRLEYLPNAPYYETVDGRHRREAYELNKLKEVQVEVVEFETEAELLAMAYKANVGGSLPPSPQDTEHTVMLLLERGQSKRSIAKLLGLPTGMARRYVDTVQSKLSRAKLLRAVAAVTDGGLTVPKAAEQYQVDAEKLKAELKGPRRKHKQGVLEIQRQMTKLFKSVGQKNASMLRKVIEKFEDGDVTEKQAEAIFSHLERLQKQSARAVTDWKSRYQAMSSGRVAKSA